MVELASSLGIALVSSSIVQSACDCSVTDCSSSSEWADKSEWIMLSDYELMIIINDSLSFIVGSSS